MSNPIRRTIRTVGSPTVRSSDVKSDSEAISQSELQNALENYIEELGSDVVPSSSQSGTVLNQIEHEIRVEIPRIDSPLHCRGVISDLEAAFVQTPAHSRWIVNLRGLDVLPLLLIGALERYQKELSESGGVVRLELSSANSYSDAILTRLASSFELHYIDPIGALALDQGGESVDIDSIVRRVLQEEGEAEDEES